MNAKELFSISPNNTPISTEQQQLLDKVERTRSLDRQRSKRYYERNRELVLEKRKNNRETNKAIEKELFNALKTDNTSYSEPNLKETITTNQGDNSEPNLNETITTNQGDNSEPNLNETITTNQGDNSEPNSQIQVNENCEYMYVLQTREAFKLKENVYKIGRTSQKNLKRFSAYPNGTKLLFQIICKNSKQIETDVIKILKAKFILRNEDYGNEYFEGNYYDIIDVIYTTVKLENLNA